MAREKESLRQAMIGMMYLVLTALLALQVSSSVLEKFVLINKSFEKNTAQNMQANATTLASIQTTIAELGNRKDDSKVLNTAYTVHKKTKQIISYVDSLKKNLIAQTGGRDAKTGFPKGLKNDAAVARLMIDDGEGLVLQKRLNGYMQYLSQTIGKKFPPIALDGKDSELFRNNINQFIFD